MVNQKCACAMIIRNKNAGDRLTWADPIRTAVAINKIAVLSDLRDEAAKGGGTMFLREPKVGFFFLLVSVSIRRARFTSRAGPPY